MSLIPIDEVVHFDVCTHHPSTGAVTDADSTPTFDVYEEATDTGLLGATNLTKRTSLTGNYRGTFTASAANGFEAGKWYNVIVSATVNSIAGKGVAMRFRVAPAESAAGVPKGDVSHYGGTAGTFSGGRPEVNTTHAAGTAWGSGAITAGAIATGAIDADAVASDAVTELQSGLATAAELAKVPKSDSNVTWNATAAAQIQTEATDALNAFGPPTNAQMEARTLAAASYATASGVSAVEADTQDLQSRIPAALIGGRIDATVDATGMESGAIDAILDDTIGDGTLTLRQALRVLIAGMAGKLSGAATTTVTIRNTADSANVIVATVDADGNRSAVTVTP